MPRPRRQDRRAAICEGQARSCFWPRDCLGAGLAALPELDSVRMDTRYSPHSPGLGVEPGMTKESPDELSSLSPPHVQPHQAIGSMRPIGTKEIAIQTEESRVRQLMKCCDQVFIIGPGGSDLHADDPETNPPLTQQEPLSFGQVFVEHQHGIPGTVRV